VLLFSNEPWEDRVSFVPAHVKPAVGIAAIEALDIRVGTIQAVGEVAGSRKLVKLTVSFGDHERSILAGLRHERPDLAVLVGRQALFVVNLEPRTMAGQVSEGMLFDIGYADGLPPALAVPERPVPDGTRAG
jgi:tRNA-binding protein